MATYIKICKQMDKTGRYMSNAIGMCLRDRRTVGGGERPRVDIFLLESETYSAFANGVDLSKRFDPKLSFPGYLIWTHDLKSQLKHPPFPVSVDRYSGIVRQEDSQVYGFLSDVANCLFLKDNKGIFQKWNGTTKDSKCSPHTESEIRASSALTSSASSMASNRRRIGQGGFRQEVMAMWGGKCAITRCTAVEVLRASHIVRWADSPTAVQLDPYNGILLAAHLDAAFEFGLISFLDNGTMVFSPRFTKGDRAALGLKGNEHLRQVFPQSLKFLRDHRQRHGFGHS